MQPAPLVSSSSPPPRPSPPDRSAGTARAELFRDLEGRSLETQLGSAGLLAREASGDERERLLRWFERVALDDRGQHVTRRAAEGVGGLVGEGQSDWALDLYFRVAHASFEAHLVHPFGLLGVLERLPRSVRADRFRRESASPSAAVRRAAFEGSWRLGGDLRRRLLLLFRGERHPSFCRRVRSLLELEGL